MNLLWGMRFFKKGMWLYIIGILLIIIDSFSKVYLEWMQKNIIDIVFVEGNLNEFPWLLFKLAIVWLIPVVTFMGSAMACNIAGYNMRRNFTKSLLERIFKTPMYIFQNKRVGKYINIFNYDVEKVSQEISYTGIPMIIDSIAGLIFVIVAIYLISPMSLLVAVVVGIIYLALSRYFSKKIENVNLEVRESHNDLIVHIEESVSSTREIIAFQQQQWQKKIFTKLYDKYFKNVMNECKITNQSILVGQPIKWIIILSVMFIGGCGVIENKVSIGGFVILYQYTDLLLANMENIYDSFVSMGSVLASIKVIKKTFNEDTDQFGNKEIKGNIHKIEFKNVNFSYNKEQDDIIRNLSFTIPVGKKVAIVGVSGCGKSTISKLLTRLYRVSSGQILINGENINEYDYISYSKKFSIVFQEPYIFPDTLYNNLILGNREIGEESIRKICELACIDDYIQSLKDKYYEEIGERGITLSGGQRQRVVIAREILKNSEVLILDEATSALDVETEKKVFNNIDKIRKGKTTIIIAHRISTIMDADIILVINNGQCIGSGNHHELYAKCHSYKQLIDSL